MSIKALTSGNGVGWPLTRSDSPTPMRVPVGCDLGVACPLGALAGVGAGQPGV
jgi:hypothetical protein